MAQNQMLMETFQGQSQNIESTKSAITKMLVRTERFQTRVRKHIDENYTEFMPNHTSPDIFLEKSSILGDEINELLATVGEEGLSALNDASAELAKSSKDLREIMLELRVSEHILKLDDLFQCVEEAKANKDCLVVFDLMGKLRSLIYSEAKDSTDVAPEVERLFQSLDCYESIKVKYHVQAHLLQQNLQKRFDRLVQLNCKTFPNSKCVTLLISKDEAQLQDIVTALFQERYNPAKLCNFLLEHCIEPLIQKPVSVEYNETAKDGSHIQLTLSYSIKDQDASSPLLRPSYKDVFDHFRLLLQTLGGINSNLNGTQHVFSIIGDQIKDRMLQLLVEECLISAVPETMDEYNSSTLCVDVLQFEHLLADAYLINPEVDCALTEFTKEFDTYYRNRLSARVLATAREIIQRDLQDMILVAPNNLSANVASDPFLFPRCMISKSAQASIIRFYLPIESYSIGYFVRFIHFNGCPSVFISIAPPVGQMLSTILTVCLTLHQSIRLCRYVRLSNHQSLPCPFGLLPFWLLSCLSPLPIGSRWGHGSFGVRINQDFHLKSALQTQNSCHSYIIKTCLFPMDRTL